MPRMLQRLVLFSVLLPLLTIFQPWSRETCAEDATRAAALPADAPVASPVVTAIDVLKSDTGTRVTISGEGTMLFEYFVIGGKSLLIDIPGASSKVRPAERPVDDEFVSRIQVAARTGEEPGVRIALALKKPDDFTVRGESGRIVVAFAARRDSASPNQPQLNRVVEVTAARIANAVRVAVKTDAKPAYRVLESNDPKRITVAIDGARLEPDSRTTSDYSGLDTPVTRISSWSEPTDPTVVLLAIDLRQPAAVPHLRRRARPERRSQHARSRRGRVCPAPAGFPGAHPGGGPPGPSHGDRRRSGERPRKHLCRQENFPGIPGGGHHGYLPPDRRHFRHEHRGNR